MRVTVPNLDTLPQWAKEAFQAVMARINTVFVKEHTGDGAHTAITATSLDATGTVAAGDGLVIGSAVGAFGNTITYDGNQIIVGIPGTGASNRFTIVNSSGTGVWAVTATGIVAVTGYSQAPYFVLTDGVTAPGATSGVAKIYVDTADGDLKVVFGDGVVKTIVTDV